MRIAVTGIGLISPFGVGIEAYWQGAAEGRSAVRTIEHFDCSDLPVRFGAPLSGFDPERWIDRKTIKNTDPFSHIALAASALALEDAGLAGDGALDVERTGVIVGSGVGGLLEIHEQIGRFVERGPSRLSPFFIPKMMVNAASGMVAIRYGLRGPNFATASACAAAAHALGMAVFVLRSGQADVMLAGGSEAALNRVGMASFCSSRALSTRNDAPERASRPFDRGRDGFVMGEGGGVFVLETWERATARGARIYAELAGFGASDDGHHITAPEPEGRGAAQSMGYALRDAGVAPEDVGFVAAHGTSTPLGDVAETIALKRAFGDHARRLAVGATKSQVGHLLGAAAVISAASAIYALHRGVLLPTINLDDPDPACDLDYVPHTAREAKVDVALANAFGFGGHNATLAFKRVP